MSYNYETGEGSATTTLKVGHRVLCNGGIHEGAVGVIEQVCSDQEGWNSLSAPQPWPVVYGSAPWWGGLAMVILPTPAPAVTSVSPSAGASGTSCTIEGTGFSSASGVYFGSTSGSYTVNSSTSITATSPPGTGTVDVTVAAPSGTSPTSEVDDFTYTYAGPYSLSMALSQAVATVTFS